MFSCCCFIFLSWFCQELGNVVPIANDVPYPRAAILYPLFLWEEKQPKPKQVLIWLCLNAWPNGFFRMGCICNFSDLFTRIALLIEETTNINTRGCADLCPFCWALLPYFLTPSGSFLIQAARLSSALQPSCLHLPYQSYWSTEQLLGSLGITWRGSASSHGSGYPAESLPPAERLLVMQLEAVQLEVVQL